VKSLARSLTNGRQFVDWETRRNDIETPLLIALGAGYIGLAQFVARQPDCERYSVMTSAIGQESTTNGSCLAAVTRRAILRVAAALAPGILLAGQQNSSVFARRPADPRRMVRFPEKRELVLQTDRPPHWKRRYTISVRTLLRMMHFSSDGTWRVSPQRSTRAPSAFRSMDTCSAHCHCPSTICVSASHPHP
jgi:hypothetical protein